MLLLIIVKIDGILDPSSVIRYNLFLGRPPRPRRVTAAVARVGVLNISWSFEFTDRVDVDFILAIVKFNSSEEPMTLTTKNLFHVVPSPSTMACDVYQFWVIARNAAGHTSSGYITSTFPFLPASPPDNSIQHFLEITAHEITLHVMIMVS